MKKCENCKYYVHSPNILGGLAECILNVKHLNSMLYNDACKKHAETKKDNLQDQKDFYKKHLK